MNSEKLQKVTNKCPYCKRRIWFWQRWVRYFQWIIHQRCLIDFTDRLERVRGVYKKIDLRRYKKTQKGEL